MGTPQFAVPTLKALVEAGHTVAAVYTQPDRPKGRGQELTPSPVKEEALRLALHVEQPLRVRKQVEELRAFGADAMVVVGYGQIIPQAIIDLPKYGIINVHASLLPKYRGAAPIQWAIARGETVTGVTTMKINAGLDTGDMLLKWETPIGSDETSVDIAPRLASHGAALLIETLEKIETIEPIKQNDAEATLAPILKKEDGLIDFALPATEIFNRVRGFQPWPGVYTQLRGQRFHLWKAAPASISVAPAELHQQQRRLFIGCGNGTSLELIEVQLEGRKRMPVPVFLNGFTLTENERLS
jgi:methionyl-tRNA formyltransferase